MGRESDVTGECHGTEIKPSPNRGRWQQIFDLLTDEVKRKAYVTDIDSVPFTNLLGSE